MKLRRLLATTANTPWHSIAVLNPLFDDQPDSPFVVKVRLPTGNIWVGQWPPTVDDATLHDIVDEILVIRTDALAIPPPADAPPVKKVPLADGTTIDVREQPTRVIESEADEDARLQRELDAMPLVFLEVNETQYVAWQGFEIWLQPGINEVPKAFADVYREARMMNQNIPTAFLDLDQRIARGLSPIPRDTEVQGAINANRRTPKRVGRY